MQEKSIKMFLFQYIKSRFHELKSCSCHHLVLSIFVPNLSFDLFKQQVSMK